MHNVAFVLYAFFSKSGQMLTFKKTKKALIIFRKHNVATVVFNVSTIKQGTICGGVCFLIA